MNRRPDANPTERFFQFALLGLLATGFLALASSRSLDWPVIAIAIASILARASMVLQPRIVPTSPEFLTAATIACTVFYPLDYYLLSHDFLTATVHGFCFIAAVKLITARSSRDYIYVGAVALFELAGAALLSLDALFFVWLALSIFFAASALTAADMRRGWNDAVQIASVRRPHLNRRLSALTIAAAGGIVIITAGLFLVVPRTARAAARFLPASRRLTGFTSTVDLATFGAISKDSRPVMHVMSYRRKLPEGLKWRGATLSRFDGKRWWEPTVFGTVMPAGSGPVEVAGALQRSRMDAVRLLYRVDLEVPGEGVLFIAGIPEFINVPARRLVRTASDSFRALPASSDALSYEVSAHAGAPLPVELTGPERNRYLRLPPIDSRIPTLASQWAGEGSPSAQARRIESSLRTGFRYTLDTTHGAARDPLAHFLFDDRSGYCEYFASAMAVMLRTRGIPARVATGFQSGAYNGVSGLQVIRASDAHAWVEAWFAGRGWVTFDPTPSVMPDEAGWLNSLNMYLDAADGVWQQWVVGYDPVHQATLALRVESAWKKWRKPAVAIPWRTAEFVLAPMAAVPLLWFAFRRLRLQARIRRIARGAGSTNDATLLYRQLLASLKKRGFEKPNSSTPLEFAGALPAHEQVHALQLTELYNAARFGADSSAAARLADTI